MKVLILTNLDVGLYRFRIELVNELLKHHEVIISMPDGEFVEEFEKIGCTVFKTDIDRRGINPIHDIKLVVTYRKIFKSVKPDMVITYTIKPNIYGGFLCRCKRIPYAVNITGLGTAFQNSGLLKSFVTFLYRIGLKKAKVVFFENEENRQTLINNKITTEEQSCLLPGAGVNVETYPLSPYPSDNEITRFLFMGRVMKEKGIDELFTAMHRLYEDQTQCKLTVLGSYEEDYAESVKKYSHEGWLDYKGFQEDVKPFIEQSHCFVLPSWHEGMANTNLECASMGRPVITSNIHGCLEAVEDGVSGFLCNKQDPDDLYRVMKEFTGLSYEQRRTMGLVGRKRMEELFDKNVVVQKTIDGLFDS